MVKSSVFVLAACLCVQLNGASICEPQSTFIVDCNNCTCSKNGMEYSCTNYVCPPPKYEDKYDVKIIKGGYRVLVPKNNDRFASDDNDFVLTKKNRVPRTPKGFPYINDEIPSSKEFYESIRERNNNDIDERDKNDIDDRYNNDIDERDNSAIDERRYIDRRRYDNDIFEGDNNEIEERYNSDIGRRRTIDRKRYNNDIDGSEERENDLTFDEDDVGEDSEQLSEEGNDNDESYDVDEDIDRNRKGRFWRKLWRSRG